MTKLYEGFHRLNISVFVSTFLHGDAGVYYDALMKQPACWSEFITLMEKIYGPPKLDRATMYHTVLSRKQRHDQDTKKFARMCMIWD